MSVKLYYFNSNGTTEYIRYMLHYGKIEFEDVRYETWPIKSVKDSLPFGQLPLYEEGDFRIAQSLAIGRYVAHKVGLLPSDVKEQAELDAIALSIYDLRTHGSKIFYERDPKGRAELKSKFLDEHVPFYFSRFENILKKNNGYFNGKLFLQKMRGSPKNIDVLEIFCGDGVELSWVDFLLVGVVELFNPFYRTELEKGYSTIKALIAKIQVLPGVKEYIEERKSY